MSKTKQLVINGKNILARAMDRYKERAELNSGARIGFLIDATASREDSWEYAQTIQAKMFRSASSLKALKLRLVYFGGNQLTRLSWNDNPHKIAARMAAVRCRAGLTQIIPGLEAFIDDAPENRANAIILVGDSFEEDSAIAAITAILLKNRDIKVFSFVEGDDWTAHSVFKNLAAITGGKFAKFGDDLPLGDLCEGVALLASGGEKALKRLENDKVRLLLTGPSKAQK